MCVKITYLVDPRYMVLPRLSTCPPPREAASAGVGWGGALLGSGRCSDGARCAIAEAAKSMPGALDLLSKERVRDLDVDQPAAAGGRLQSYERLPKAMNEVWNLGPHDPQRRLEGDQGRYVGCVRRARARLSPSAVYLVCLVGAGYPRCSSATEAPARSRTMGLVPSWAAGRGAFF
jgi:hypothetical protein